MRYFVSYRAKSFYSLGVTEFVWSGVSGGGDVRGGGHESAHARYRQPPLDRLTCPRSLPPKLLDPDLLKGAVV